MTERVEGRHPVLAAIESGRAGEVLVAEGTDQTFMRRLKQAARGRGVAVKIVPRTRISSMARTRGHQGVIANVTAFRYVSTDDIVARARRSPTAPLVVVAAAVEDPHNLGTIARTAECAGAIGLIIPERRSAAITPAVTRVAAGALERLPVARVTNISRSLDELKDAGLWVWGAEADAEIRHWEADLTVPLALVLGGEHRGIPRLVRQRCDGLVSIPVLGRTGSLNVSQAAAIVIYEAVRQRRATVPSANLDADRDMQV